jgi:hypothetical protein
MSHPRTVRLLAKTARRVKRDRHLTQIVVGADSELHAIVWQDMWITLSIDVGLRYDKLLCYCGHTTTEHTHQKRYSTYLQWKEKFNCQHNEIAFI